MKSFRTIVGILAILPMVMIVDSLIHPANYCEGTLGELLYPVFGVPILIFNMCAWAHPEIIEFYFFVKEKEDL